MSTEYIHFTAKQKEAGDYMKAGLYYEQVIREHGFSQAAYVVSTYVGYGRTLIAQKKYKSALEKLQIGKEISEKNITSLFRREDRKSTRLNSSHIEESRMPSSA